MKELEALAILTGTPLLGSIKIRLLVQRFGSASEALNASIHEIEELPGFGQKICSGWGWWKSDRSWLNDLELADQQGVRLISFNSPEYPKRLLDTHDFPILLYVKGELQKRDSDNGIAIVGTRNASIYGRTQAESFGHDLAAVKYSVVSGLARGIDTAAHIGALHAGRTIAVIGSGLANIYPRENLSLAEKIAENGAVISEFSMRTPPDRQNFPRRNRIVSGMTRCALLIEAPIKSGAMITMDQAEAQGRPLFALPNRVDDVNAKGNHCLIKSGRASLVEEAADIIAAMDGEKDLFGPFDKKTAPARVFLEPEEENLLKLLSNEEAGIEKIASITKLPMMKLNVLLMSLVLKKVIKEFPGKIYKRVLPAR